MDRFALSGLVGLSALLIGCGGAAPSAGGAGGAAASRERGGGASCERRNPGQGAVRGGEPRQGGAVALVHSGNETLAYIADEDSRAVHTVSLDRGVELATTPLAGSPAQLLVLADGRVAVTLRDVAALAVLEPTESAERPLQTLCTVDVPAEPFGLAVTPDDRTVLVTSAWAATLTTLDAASLRAASSTKIGREPRAVVVDDEGRRAFVSHAVGGKLTVVDLAGPRDVRHVDLRVRKRTPRVSGAADDNTLRAGVQGFALAKSVDGDAAGAGELPKASGVGPRPAPARPRGRIFAPFVTVDPGDPNQPSSEYYGPAPDGIPKEAPLVGVVDAASERSATRTVISLGNTPTAECLLPRAAAVRPQAGTLLVGCVGLDAVLELDTAGADPMRLELRRWKVPAGPIGLAVDERGSRAVVWSQFDGKVSVLDLSSAKKTTPRKIAVRYRPVNIDPESARGRRLFHATDDQRIAFDGIACASCHPDGREDALTWSTSEGPRQTIMLAGRTPNSAPYGWIGAHGDLPTYLANTLQRLGGTGLQGAEMSALVAYLDGLPGPATLAPTAGSRGPSLGSLGIEARRGRDLFFAEQNGCSSCHVGGAGTDAHTHDVGSRTNADGLPRFDTPSLRFVRGTAPYFHDGRYSTLSDLLRANDSQMGHTAHLVPADIAALEAYLETL